MKKPRSLSGFLRALASVADTGVYDLIGLELPHEQTK